MPLEISIAVAEAVFVLALLIVVEPILFVGKVKLAKQFVYKAVNRILPSVPISPSNSNQFTLSLFSAPVVKAVGRVAPTHTDMFPSKDDLNEPRQKYAALNQQIKRKIKALIRRIDGVLQKAHSEKKAGRDLSQKNNGL